MPIFRALQSIVPKKKPIKLKNPYSLINQAAVYQHAANTAFIGHGTGAVQVAASGHNVANPIPAVTPIGNALTVPSSQALTAVAAPPVLQGAHSGNVQFIQTNSSTAVSNFVSGNLPANYIAYNQISSGGLSGVTIVNKPVRKWIRQKLKGKWVKRLVDTDFVNDLDVIAASGFNDQKRQIARLVWNIITGLKVAPVFKRSVDKKWTRGERVAFNPGDVEAWRINPETKVLLPNGQKLLVDKRGNFRIYDKQTRVVRAGATQLDFNKYLNASDLLEQFIKDLGVAGVTQTKVLKVPIHAFINWIILKSAEADDIPPPPDIPKLEALSDVMELKAQPTINNKCRCIQCGHFLSETMERMGMKFCNGSCMNKYVRKMKKYEKKLPCCI